VTIAKPTDQIPLQDWKRVVDTNLTGAFLCSREALKIMKPQNSGRISASAASRRSRAVERRSLCATSWRWKAHALDRARLPRAHIGASIIHLGRHRLGLDESAPEDATGPEYHLPLADVGRLACVLASLPTEANMFETTILPIQQRSFVGRGKNATTFQPMGPWIRDGIDRDDMTRTRARERPIPCTRSRPEHAVNAAAVISESRVNTLSPGMWCGSARQVPQSVQPVTSRDRDHRSASCATASARPDERLLPPPDERALLDRPGSWSRTCWSVGNDAMNTARRPTSRAAGDIRPRRILRPHFHPTRGGGAEVNDRGADVCSR